MRFIAIILVVFGHVRWMTKGFPAPIRALLHGSGILGVELFCAKRLSNRWHSAKGI